VIFDNLRILHARTAFSQRRGRARHRQGCYADLDALESSIEPLTRATVAISVGR
jgi:gamma-butyrobetaine dioxygenase